MKRRSRIRARYHMYVFLLLLCATGVLAQTSVYYERTTALPDERSRAEKEADRLSYLSADKIISVLQEEPGLLLICKKLLVRTAYQQGRLLDPLDLDDDVLFRLIRSDVNVRVMFTHELESRNYIHAKPTKEELERDWLMGRVPTMTSNTPSTMTPGTNQVSTPENEEDAYWRKHEDDLQKTIPPNLYDPGNTLTQVGQPTNRVPGYTSSPSYAPPGTLRQTPQQTVPQTQPTYDDSRRSLLQANAQSQDNFDLPEDADSLPRISADQLSSLIDARMSGASTNFGGSSSDQGNTRPGAMGNNGSISSMGESSGFGGLMSGLPPSSSSDLDTTRLPQTQASLDTRYSSTLPPYYYPLHKQDKQPTLRHRANPYADIPSLYDLYAQYARRSPKLERFGADVFENGTGNFDELPMDMPVGPDYVLGPGDGLSIDLTGSVSQRLRRVVDREGKLVLPEAGAVQVTGKTLGDVQHMVQNALRTQFRDVQADISLARLRSVRVYVVGDVERPGAYDVSSLSTPLNAVYEAGGPTTRGSLRILEHYRGKQLVERVDVYDLLLHGVRSGTLRLEAGDTVRVPPLGQEITIQGMVRRPAIYELNGEKSLAEALELAGGVLPSGTLRHVDVERTEAHETRSMLSLDIPENDNQDSVTQALEKFNITDGDKIQISPILPYADRTVYLEGHVFRPGKFAYHDGMKVTDLIKSYKDLLPEPYKQHAEIIRLKAPDRTPEIMAFNLDDALSGKEQDVVLQPFDTVRVFGRFDFEDQPVITVTGEVRDPGDHVTNGALRLRDAVYLAGNTTWDAALDDAQVFRKTDDGKLKVFSVNLNGALAGNPKDNIMLLPKDRLFIHKDLTKTDPPSVTVEGEVGRPGKYPLGDGMTAADLVRFAGGLKRSAFTQEADLTRYTVEHGNKVVGDVETIEIAKALAGEPDSDKRLHDGDVLTIRQLAGWNDMGATIKVTGEVMHPGTYGIQEGERLSSIIQRAGGLRGNAYPYGAVFLRAQVREMEDKNRAQLVDRLKEEQIEMKTRPLPGQDPDEVKAKQGVLMQYEAALEKLQHTPPAGRMVIHISSKLKNWANTSSDIQVRAGDEIYIPKKPSIVLVDGSVYNPTGVTVKPGKSAGWYLQRAGGPTQMANKRATFVIRADGSIVGGSGGLFSGGADSAVLQAGDMVIVPEKSYTINNKWKNTIQAAQLAYAVGIAIQVSRSF